MKLLGIKTPIIEPTDNLAEVILESIPKGERLEDEDILMIASSVVSTVTGRIRNLDEFVPSEKARRLAKDADIDDRLAEVVIQEADRVLGPGQGCVLTMKEGMLKVNAGVDRTNVPKDQILLLPEDPKGRAEELRKELEDRTGVRIGVGISDSHVNPLRLGTIGQLLGSSGINEVVDFREKEDLFGRKLKITFKGIGDQIASAGQLVMGESNERVPVVLVRGVADAFAENDGRSQKISPDGCVYKEICDYENEYR